MENSRISQSADLAGHVAARLREHSFPGAHYVLGLSGGLDSVCLLQILAELAGSMRFSLRAVHINHGLSPNAGDWAEFCRQLCLRLGIPLAVDAVDVSPYRHLGPEAAAREARWQALRRHSADFLLLAQHQDDQAETLMLQLLRGAGPAGLAGMASGVAAVDPSQSLARVLRPMLALGRSDILDFSLGRGYRWIEDESNSSEAFERNFLRHKIMPALAARYPHAAKIMARSASILAEASGLLAELGRHDLQSLEKSGGLDWPGLRSLGEARARNALRTWCSRRGFPVPGYARTREIWRQLCESRKDNQLCIEWQGISLRRYRSLIFVENIATPAPMAFAPLTWDGEPWLPLIALGGALNFKPEEGRGLSLQKLRLAPVSVRLRQGGERIRIDPRRPRRTLKNLWQELGLPPWLRERHPLLYCGEQLVAVPGLGEDCQWRAAPGERGLIVSWQAYGSLPPKQ